MSALPVITLDNVLDLLEKAVQTRGPDYRYRGQYEDVTCKYEKDGAPSCLVGVALHIAGVSVDELTAMDKSLEPGMGPHWLEENTDNLPISISESATMVLSQAQATQDIGYTWGEALERAKQEHRRLVG